MAGLTKGQRARIEGYDRDNRECAAIILADIKRYGGEGSLAVRWARTILAKSTSPKGKEHAEEIQHLER